MTQENEPTSSQGAQTGEPADGYKAIADEIIQLNKEDQAMIMSGQWDREVMRANVQRMQKIVTQIGWPTRSKVGDHASQMAWLFVQNADEYALHKMCLDLMHAEPTGEVLPADIAYLEDKVRIGEQRPQLYGTQFYTDEAGNFGPIPIEDPEHVDERRKAVGLEPLSEYTHHKEQVRKQMRK